MDIHNVVLAAMLALNSIAFLSMLLYIRGDSEFKRSLNVLAYILMVATALNVFRIVTPIGHDLPINLPELVWQTILCMTIIHHKGNVSYLMPKRRHHDQ